MKHNFWYWEKVIPEEICEIIKLQFSEDQKEEAQVKNGIVNKILRTNDVCWLKPNHWVEGILFNHIRYANVSAEWNFDIRHIQQIQLTRYKKSNFYDWHIDESIFEKQASIRKLSVVLLLSNPEEYEGGGLFIRGNNNNILKNKGDIVVFPSFLEHKAAEVTDGVRMTAVGWANGPEFILR